MGSAGRRRATAAPSWGTAGAALTGVWQYAHTAGHRAHWVVLELNGAGWRAYDPRRPSAPNSARRVLLPLGGPGYTAVNRRASAFVFRRLAFVAPQPPRSAVFTTSARRTSAN